MKVIKRSLAKFFRGRECNETPKIIANIFNIELLDLNSRKILLNFIKPHFMHKMDKMQNPKKIMIGIQTLLWNGIKSFSNDVRRAPIIRTVSHDLFFKKCLSLGTSRHHCYPRNKHINGTWSNKFVSIRSQ